MKFAYTRDAVGNPTAIERESGLGTYYYEYDALGRLSYEGQFISGAREYENYYEYDAAGNRTLLRHGETGAEDVTYYTYNAANELTRLHGSAGWTYFAYDANGNTVKEQTPSYTRYYDWDGRDMMTGVRSTEDGWTDNIIRYNGEASRMSLSDSGGTTYYTWDGIRVLTTEDEEGALRQRQVHGQPPGGIPSVGDIALIESAAGDAYVPTADQVGTVWNLLDGSAAVANSYEYDAFGIGRAASETFANRYRFGTKRLDEDTELYHFIARQYMPVVGRFLSRDPVRRYVRTSRHRHRRWRTRGQTVRDVSQAIAPQGPYIYSKAAPLSWVDIYGLREYDVAVFHGADPELGQDFALAAVMLAPYAFDVGSAGDMIRSLKDLVEDPDCDCIEHLYVLGHGEPLGGEDDNKADKEGQKWVQEVGQSILYAYVLSDLCHYFCEPVYVTLYGCYVGTNVTYMDELWGACEPQVLVVTACTGRVEFRHPWYGGSMRITCKGEWVPSLVRPQR
ncbi:MAG: RHS repeat-associated core domain-containing protein [Candidatus Brocadiia bacterium]